MLVLDSVTQILIQSISASKLDSEVARQNLGLDVQTHTRIIFVHQKEVNGSTLRSLVCINKCTKEFLSFTENKKRKVMKSIQRFLFSFDSYSHPSLSECIEVLHSAVNTLMSVNEIQHGMHNLAYVFIFYAVFHLFWDVEKNNQMNGNIQINTTG